MKYSPLHLHGCYFVKLNLSAQAYAKKEDLNRFDLDVKSDVSPDANRSRYFFITLVVKITSEKEIIIPYAGEIEVIGVFSVDESWPEELVEKLVFINGSGLLFAAVREMVCTITGRGFYDMLVLPSVSFNEMYKELEETRKAEADKAQSEGKLQGHAPTVTTPATGVEAVKSPSAAST